MLLIGVGYTLIENARHRNDPGWPWLTWLGLMVLGVVGPALAWFVLRWAVGAARIQLAAQGELGRRHDQLSALNRLSGAASSSLDLKNTLDTVLEQTMKALDAEAGMVFLQTDPRPGLHLATHRGISVEMANKEARLDPGHCLCGQAVENRQILFASDIGMDHRCTSDVCICEGFRSVACAPLEAKGKLVGLLQLASPNPSHFTANEQDFIAAVAGQASASIENARLYDTVRTFNVELEQKVNRRTRELELARWELSEKARRLQRLLSESYRVQENTQSRIAHDMHDGVTQLIIGALYETEAARQAVTDDPERAEEGLTRAQKHLTEVENEIRRVIYDLHPPTLDAMGLVVTLKRYATTFNATFGVDCLVTTGGVPRRLSSGNEIAIYRMVQAALHNVATHAKAKQASVSLIFEEQSMQVCIDDDGVGFDPDAMLTAPGEHLGLIGMKERAESIGAKLDVSSEANHGTHIAINIKSPQYVTHSELSERGVEQAASPQNQLRS